ncbi:MAG: tetratricopeptide repeat protein [Candidatus Delongbacteria bacterium]|nr:tetratricopeptide repeat protein [Candidatus Delongbacteria bacterium]MCG2760540.1 tetratricopeptide repeat protein [Candidatus Delongbacteria bacterium]
MKHKLLTLIILWIMSVSLIAKDSPEASKARIFFKNNDFENAIEWFQKALEKDEENSDLYFMLGVSYTNEIGNVNFFTKGIYSSKAKSNLKLSIKKDPKNIEARYYLASYYFNAPAIGGGDKDEAWKQAEEIFKLSPVKGHEIKAQFYSQEKEYNKALTEYDKIIRSDSLNTHVYYLKGITYQQTKEFDKAYESFESALKIDPNSLESLYQIGRNAVFSNKYLDRGIECLNIYLQNKPDTTLPQPDAAYWRLAMIYKIKGEKTLAKEAVSKAISINSENKDYKKMLDELK